MGYCWPVDGYDFDTTVLLYFFKMQISTDCFAMTPGQKSGHYDIFWCVS